MATLVFLIVGTSSVATMMHSSVSSKAPSTWSSKPGGVSITT